MADVYCEIYLRFEILAAMTMLIVFFSVGNHLQENMSSQHERSQLTMTFMLSLTVTLQWQLIESYRVPYFYQKMAKCVQFIACWIDARKIKM
jgi:hypothetical protein